MKKFRFHFLSLCHLPQSKEYLSCAFTQKNLKLSKMLISLGHEVFFYGSEGSNPICSKFIETHKLEDIRRDYGDGDNRFQMGYNWHNTDFRHDFNSKKKSSTLKFYSTCIKYINSHKRDNDFLLCSQGPYFKPIIDAVKLYLTCEPGVGYRGSCLPFRAFESAYIQNFTYGSENPRECINGNYYDRVIPNYFDEDDIEFSANKEDYFLFIGRMIRRKGILIASKVCEVLGKKLIIVGQGAEVKDGWLVPTVDPDFRLAPGNWEYLGFADVERRKKLMAHARAVFAPTEYLECFAGTHIESMLSGTPVLTTDFGVFPGTVINGLNGYRCNNLDDFVYHAGNINKLDPQKVRWSAEKYLMNNVRWDFEKWFEDLYQLYLSSLDNKEPRTVFGFNHIRDKVPEFRNNIKW
jgi:glycosyltransferase involved in cell wall biosynthesis